MPTVKVISLERTPQRRAEFARANARLSFSFFEAIDGTKMTLPEIDATGCFARDLNYTPGAIGCALSHIRLWDRVIETGQAMTIMEDDAIARFDFEPTHERLLHGLPADWDFVLWGWNFDAALELNIMRGISPNIIMFDQNVLRQAVNKFQFLNDVPSLLPLQKAFGTPAYSISPAGAQKFKSLCLPLCRFNLAVDMMKVSFPNSGIDMAMSRVYVIANAFVSLPPLAVTRNVPFSSTVQTGYRGKN